MPSITNKETDFTRLIDFWVLLYLIGIICSKALLAVGMVGLSGTALWHWLSNKNHDRRGLAIFLIPSIILVITLLSGLNSDNKTLWLEFVLKKLPFLVLPLAFFSLKDYLAKRYYDYLVGFVFLIVTVSLGVLGNYIMNFEDLNQAIGKGKSITTPIDHTEFSIFVAFAACVSLFVYIEQKKVFRIGTRATQLLVSIFLILFLHILAVRSGLAVFYGTIFLVGTYHFIKQKKYTALAGLIAAIVLVPMIAINTIPSLKKKISYVNWDLRQYKLGEGLNYSDSERLYSLKIGLDIFNDNKIAGIGIGDMRAGCDARYQEYLGKSLPHYPHNQYLFALAAMGILGFLCYMTALIWPLIALRRYLDPYFLCLHSVVLISALAENTIERTYSIGFYLFFLLLGIAFLCRQWEPQK